MALGLVVDVVEMGVTCFEEVFCLFCLHLKFLSPISLMENITFCCLLQSSKAK